MKLLIVAGGGGHFAPALAVIEKLPKDWEVMVVGRKYTFEGEKTESLEYQTAKKLGIKFQTITTGRLQRRLTRHTLLSLIKVPVGFFQALKVLKAYQPDIVLSFGGYISFPVALAAKAQDVPIVIHEQILGAGLSNKLVAKFAEKVCISWKESEKFFPSEKVVLTGNPIRGFSKTKSPDEKILHPEQSRRVQNDRKLIYITGGSGGAHAINLLIEECLERLLKNYQIIHQTGDAKSFKDFDRLEKKKASLTPELQKRYTLNKFVDSVEVLDILKKADLVISRAGINTITELLYFGKPSLLIPLPYGQHNEQLTNALFVKKIGLAEVAEQKDLTDERLYEMVATMMQDLQKYTKHSKAATELIHLDAAEKILTVVFHVNNQKKST